MDGLTPARPDDVEPLFALINEYFDPLLGPLGQWDARAERRAFLKSFRPGSDRVIRRDGQARGYWSVREVPGAFFLTYAVLGRELRGQGLGTALLDQVKNEARERRFAVELTVHRANPARFFYRRAAFTAVLVTDTKIRMRYAPELTQAGIDRSWWDGGF